MRWIVGCLLCFGAMGAQSSALMPRSLDRPAVKSTHADAAMDRDVNERDELGNPCEVPTGTPLGSDLVVINPRELRRGFMGCVSSPPPQTAPFGDALWHVLTNRLRYRVGKLREIIVVPKGFVTDFASIPPVFWSDFPKDGPYLSAAILHDYLYWDQRCTKAQADQLFKMEMEQFGVAPGAIRSIYNAVSRFGQGAWNENARLRLKVPRVLPEAMLDELLAQDYNEMNSWEFIKKRMLGMGIPGTPDIGNFDLAGVCRRATESQSEFEAVD